MLNVNNLCQFEGRIVSDPTIEIIKVGGKDFKKAKFTLAVDKPLTQKQRNEYKNMGKPTSDFPMFEALGSSAEFIEKWAGKGKAIKVIASFNTYSYTDKNGNKQYGYGFEVANVGFTVSSPGSNNNNQGNNNNSSNNSSSNNNNNNFNVPTGESIF